MTPHKHGTAIAGLIAAHGKLMGAAPAAHILAMPRLRRFRRKRRRHHLQYSQRLDWAAAHGARVINMSFAGPPDPALHRSLDCRAQERHRAGGGRRQCRAEIAAALSRRRSGRDRGDRDRRRGQIVRAIQPRPPHRGGGAGRANPGRHSRRQLRGVVRHLLFRGGSQRHCRADARASSAIFRPTRCATFCWRRRKISDPKGAT